MKQLKIFFHKEFYHQNRRVKPVSILIKIKLYCLKAFKVLFFGLFGAFYLFGKWIIQTLIFLIESGQKQVFQTALAFQKRLKLFKTREFFYNHAYLILGAACIILLFSSAQLFAEGIEVKQQVMSWFGRGQGQLQNAKDLLGGKDLEGASQKFSLAIKNFRSANEQITEANLGLRVFISVLPKGSDGQKIIGASSQLSQSGRQLIEFYSGLQSLKLTAEGLSGGNVNAQIIKNAQSNLALSSENLSSASKLLAEVDEKNVPKGQRAEFLQLRGEIAKISEISKNLSSIFNLFASAILKSNNILLIMENNNELRAGGGFIGSYASISQNAGKMSKMKLGSIYDLDGQLRDFILPPFPMFAVNGRWFMRDSNWFVSFPKSAQKIAQFYEKEGGETPDLIIALTPNLIVDILKLTGPVEMPRYDVLLTPENFIEKTQSLTQMTSETPENHPKQFLADLMPVLLQRLGTLKFEQLDGLLGMLFENLNSKHLLFYSRWPEIQEQIESFNWGGAISKAERDYLNISSSNLGGTKTDLFIDQKIDLITSIDSEGKIINELTLTYKNKLPKLTNTFNTRFIRVLVPKNSKLISNSGFDLKKLDAPNLRNYKFDPDARTWEKSALTDVLTGTLIGEESGYTFFANWLTLEGGQDKQIKLIYELPFNLKNLDTYSMLMQKQPGAMDYLVTHQIKVIGRDVLWTSFDNTQTIDNTFKTGSILNQDRFWGMVIQSRNQ